MKLREQLNKKFVQSVVDDAARYKEWFESAMVMIDNVPVGVAWCDPTNNLQITYINHVGRDMLKPVARHLEFPIDDMVGKKIDYLFRSPLFSTGTIHDPAKLPLHHRVKLGDVHLDVKANAIRNAAGAFIGVMVSWTDVSLQAQLSGDFQGSVGTGVESLEAAVAAVRGSARSMSDNCTQANLEAAAVSAASEQASMNVQTVASAAEELASSNGEIARQVVHSAEIASQAVKDINKTVASVGMLEEAAQKIGLVVKLINDIASQTNLLALNATIEAARAGEAGKGFAVVANEVKSLASQTARATSEIGSQVSEIQATTKDAAESIHSVNEIILRIDEIATGIASAVEEQSAATREIARNIQEAASGTNDVSSNIAGVTIRTREAGAAATELLQAADSIARETSSIRGAATQFLSALGSM